MVRRLHTLFATFPGLMRIGLLIVLAGGGTDLVYHTLPQQWATIIDIYLGQSGWPIHLVIVVGMVTTLAGIFVGRASLHVSHQRHGETERSQAIK